MKRLALVVLLVLVAATAWSVDVWIKGWFQEPYIREALTYPLASALAEYEGLEPAETEESADVIVIITAIENRTATGELLGFSVGLTVVPVSMPIATGNAVYGIAPNQESINQLGQWIADYVWNVVELSIGVDTGAST